MTEDLLKRLAMNGERLRELMRGVAKLFNKINDLHQSINIIKENPDKVVAIKTKKAI